MPVPLIAPAGPLMELTALFRSWRQLSAEQWMQPQDLAERRLSRLRSVLARATRSRYYGEVLRHAGLAKPDQVELSDIEKLPFLDRQVIARHGIDAFLTVEKEGLVRVMTSGSTGTPGSFLRARLEEAEYSARWWRVYAAYGCSMRDAQINLAIVNKPPRAGPITLLRNAGVLPQVVKLGSNAPPSQVLERIQAVNPPILTGYAGAIEALADYVLSTGAEVRPPRAVFCTAMEVTDRCLELAEKAFRAPAVDVYVTNEFGVVAWSCPVRREVLHVNDDAFLIEVVGPDGRPVPRGTLGELVITSLGLTAMPLIRYRMGDMAARIEGSCECGRGLGLLTRVHGRTAHMIRRPNGSMITTPYITSLFGESAAHEWVRQYQVREEPGRRLRFLLDIRTPPSEVQRSRFTSLVHSAVGQEYQVVMEVVDRIPPAPNGKRQYLVPLAS